MTEILGVHVDIAQVAQVGGFIALAWIVVRGFLTGKIRTAREVEELRADRDARLEEAGLWRQAHDHQVEINEQLVDVIERFTGSSDTTARLIQSLPMPQEAPDA